MKMSGLAEASGLPVATLKFYLREGLLHAGRATAKTQAEYDETHVDRARLIRALREAGGLELRAVRRVLDAVDDPKVHRLGVLRAAQHALYETSDNNRSQRADGRERNDARRADTADDATDASAATRGDDRRREQTRAESWIDAIGWRIEPDDPTLAALDRAWAACSTAGIGLDEQRMDAYAAAALRIAATDLETVPTERPGAVRQVVLGTVLVDPVISALRRLAQQHLARTQGRITGDADSD